MVQYLADLTPNPSPKGEGNVHPENITTLTLPEAAAPSPLERAGVRSLSAEANAVLAEGKKLWQSYFAHTDVHTIRDELKLNRPDVGWYQVRKALQARNASGDFPPISFKPFEDAYKALTEKLQPMVYELGFLKV